MHSNGSDSRLDDDDDDNNNNIVYCKVEYKAVIYKQFLLFVEAEVP